MSFPTSPTNGQITTVNGIKYIYSTASNSWTIVPASVVVDVNAAFNQANSAFIRANNSLNANNGGTLTGNLVVWNSNVSVNVVGTSVFSVYPQGFPVIGTSSVSNITGAVRISGGLGVAGNVYATGLYDGQNSFKRVGYINIPDQGAGVPKTSNYTLALGDIGEYVRVGTGGSITIPDAVFDAGDAIMIFNDTSGSITITCSITTAYIAGTDSDKATVSLATRGIASILFISGTVCVIMGNVS